LFKKFGFGEERKFIYNFVGDDKIDERKEII
jgi:hypothetical protein